MATLFHIFIFAMLPSFDDGFSILPVSKMIHFEDGFTAAPAASNATKAKKAAAAAEKDPSNGQKDASSGHCGPGMRRSKLWMKCIQARRSLCAKRKKDDAETKTTKTKFTGLANAWEATHPLRVGNQVNRNLKDSKKTGNGFPEPE